MQGLIIINGHPNGEKFYRQAERIAEELRLLGVETDVYRNGELLNEEKYVYLDGPLFATLKGEWKVGAGEVFVMGDHRNDSMDSREIGPIKIDKIIGQAVFRLFPLSDFGKID